MSHEKDKTLNMSTDDDKNSSNHGVYLHCGPSFLSFPTRTAQFKYFISFYSHFIKTFAHSLRMKLLSFELNYETETNA